MILDDIQNKTVQVDNYQATFLTLKIDEQLFRFDFIGKKEFSLKKGVVGQFYYFEKHPLLIDYNETIVTTYINSKPDHFDRFIDELKNAIEEITEGWRRWTNYLTDKNINFTFDKFLGNVKDGSGKLSEAPFTVNQKIVAVCDKHGVLTKSFESVLKPNNYKLILVGDNYVIAKDFRNNNMNETKGSP